MESSNSDKRLLRDRVSRALRFCQARSGQQISAAGETLSAVEADAYASGVPKFGSLQEHGFSPSVEEALWEVEIERLMGVAHQPGLDSSAPMLESTQSLLPNSISLGTTDQLKRLGDSILRSLYMFIIDDGFALEDTSLVLSDRMRIHDTGDKLARITGRILDLPGRNENRAYEEGPGALGAAAATPSAVQGSPQLVIHPDDLYPSICKQDDCFYLLDQITATLAQVAVLSQENSNYWHIAVIACLSMLSAKIKVLIAKTSRQLLRRYQLPLTRHRNHGRYGAYQPMPIPHPADEAFSRYGSDVSQYCKQYTEVSRWLCDCLESVVGNFGSARPLHRPSSHLDLCALICKIGTGTNYALVYQDRWGAISGSSGRLQLNWATASLKLAFKMAAFMKTRPDPVTVTSNSGITLTARLEDNSSGSGTDLDDPPCDLGLRTVIDLVTMLAPLALASPTLGSGFSASLKTVTALAGFVDGVEAPRSSACVFKLRHVNNSNLHDISTACSLSEWPPAVASVGNSNKESLHLSPLLDDSADRKKRMMITSRHRTSLNETSRRWRFQKDSIIIDAPLYVGLVFGSTVLFVSGGFLCAFLIGERVPGVDPFNFTMFSWLVAGFVLLAAKTLWVSEWTWRDFLLRQVTCRTVQEVATVSRLHPQDVLTILLSSDGSKPMNTTGPYQGVFGREPVSGGFSVDVKTDLRTFVNCGILPIKVQTLEGPAIILLRLVAGYVNVGDIKFQGTIEGAYVCLDIPEEGEDLSAPVSRSNISWVKVFGIYNRETKFC